MAQIPGAKQREALIVLVCDPNTGRVSVNGKDWVAFRLFEQVEKRSQPSRPGQQPKEDPPGEGDDTYRCLRDDAGNCKWHCWDGEEWKNLGWDCPSCV
jgi:hypothetical protein